MQKTITINEYLKLAKDCYTDSSKRNSEAIIESQALIFFEIFEDEISNNLMQKTITINEYLKTMERVLKKLYYTDSSKRICEDVIKIESLMFFKIFGEEISNNLVDLAYDKDIEVKGKDEYFKALFHLYKYMLEYDANVFIECLEECLCS